MSRDKIILKGMRFYGRHGCLAAELELGQWFEVDLELTLDLAPAGKSDDLSDTLNYAELYALVKAAVEGPSFALIEALADRLAGFGFAWPQVERVKVLLKKPQAPLGGPLDYAAVEIERDRKDFESVHQVWLSLGSNLGDRYENLLGGASYLLDQGLELLNNSGVYETAPVGYTDQPDFYNMALHLSTVLDPLELLKLCQQAEFEHKRERTVRWGPRTLDVDILLYDRVELDLPELTLPHPRMAERAFVLGPLGEMDPGLLRKLGLEENREGIVLQIHAADVRMRLVDKKP